MLQLNNLKKLTEPRKRVGRGGKRGRYSGRGKEGQKSRTGSTSEIKAFFEGGQMPLVRRIPRRGFVNALACKPTVVNIEELERKFAEGQTVDEASLREKGLIKGKGAIRIKILGTGALTKKLTVNVHAVSASAAQAIEKAGGAVQLL
ncbi:MAG: 50S ribosomal protein L15 [Candidatus Babeliales bacterium]|jgi:large subunit ribosomal protein L15